MSIAFGGCGFLVTYYVGVMACLRKHRLHLLFDKATGASSGALAAAAHASNADLGVMMSSLLKSATAVHRRTMQTFSPSFDANEELRILFDEILPLDAHKRCSGKLFISVTKLSDYKNVLLSQFSSREELIEALLCTSFIPGFSGIVPFSMEEVHYVDGCYSDNLVSLDDNTITVSPFCGEVDICPRDNTPGIHKIYINNLPMELSAENLHRVTFVLFPPTPKDFYRFFEQGYQDTVDFLQRTNLIKCSNCLDLERINFHGAPLKWKNMLTHNQEYLDGNHCRDCNISKQKAVFDSLPEDVVEVLQIAIVEAKNDFIQFLFGFKIMMIIVLLWQPVVFMYDFIIMLFTRMLKYPHLT